MKILLAGSTGLLGQYITKELLKQGHEIYALLRDVSKCPQGCTPVQGDIAKFNLNIPLDKTPDLDMIFNCAGVINLSKKARKDNFEVNATGACEVAHFALRHKLKRIIHVSTAYTSDKPRNPYEESKWLGEGYIKEVARGFAGFHKPIPTIIFKPSILVGEYETGVIPDGIKPGAFYEFIRRMLRVHSKIEAIRRKIETTLHLPPRDFVIHIPGDPEATLNLIPVDIAARAMVEIASKTDEGIFYITNPNPPKLRELAEWVGEVIRLKIRIEPEPPVLSLNRAFVSIASDFLPYLRGEEFDSDIEAPAVDRDYIRRTLISS